MLRPLLASLVLGLMIAPFGCGEDTSDGTLPGPPGPDGGTGGNVGHGGVGGVGGSNGGGGSAGGPADACAGVTCSGHGRCEVQQDVAVCLCELGYRPNAESCDAIPGWFGVGDSELGPWDEKLDSADSGGGLGASAEYCAVVAVAVDQDDATLVLWDKPLGLRRWNGAAWEELGQPDSATALLAGDSGENPGFTLGLDGMPIVAYHSPNGLYLKRWDGASWVALGNSAIGSGLGPAGSAPPALAVAANGEPIVAWITAVGTIRVVRWSESGGAWSDIGADPAAGLGGDPLRLDLAVDDSDRPIVAWEHDPCALCSARTLLKQWDGNQWLALGESGSLGGIGDTEGSRPSIVLYEGAPTVAFQGVHTGYSDIHLLRWDGVAWSTLGGSSPLGNGSEPALSVDPSGDLWLAHGDWPTASFAMVRWDGASWSAPLGAPGPSGRSPALAFDSAGHHVVGWVSSFSGVPACYVRRHDGGAWAGYGPTISAQGLSHDDSDAASPRLKLSSEEAPRAVWIAKGPQQVQAVAWAEAAWQPYPDVALPTGQYVFDAEMGLDAASHPTVFARTEQGTLLAVWENASWTTTSTPTSPQVEYAFAVVGAHPTLATVNGSWQSYTLNVQSYAGGQWQPLGTPAPVLSGVVEEFRSLAFAGDAAGRAIASWVHYGSDSATYAAYFDGTNWSPLGAALDGGYEPSAALDSEGRPVVASDELLVSRWDGAAWVPLPGAGYNGALGDSSQSLVPAALATGPDGSLFAAWADRSSGNSEIYVMAWDGNVWHEVAGSATGGGVSNSGGHSSAPSLAVSEHYLCVSWLEPGNQQLEVSLRCALR